MPKASLWEKEEILKPVVMTAIALSKTQELENLQNQALTHEKELQKYLHIKDNFTLEGEALTEVNRQIRRLTDLIDEIQLRIDRLRPVVESISSMKVVGKVDLPQQTDAQIRAEVNRQIDQERAKKGAAKRALKKAADEHAKYGMPVEEWHQLKKNDPAKWLEMSIKLGQSAQHSGTATQLEEQYKFLRKVEKKIAGIDKRLSGIQTRMSVVEGRWMRVQEPNYFCPTAKLARRDALVTSMNEEIEKLVDAEEELLKRRKRLEVSASSYERKIARLESRI